MTDIKAFSMPADVLAQMLSSDRKRLASPHIHPLAERMELRSRFEAYKGNDKRTAFREGQIVVCKPFLGNLVKPESAMLFVRHLDFAHPMDNALIHHAAGRQSENNLDCMVMALSDDCANTAFMVMDSRTLQLAPEIDEERGNGGIP